MFVKPCTGTAISAFGGCCPGLDAVEGAVEGLVDDPLDAVP